MRTISARDKISEYTGEVPSSQWFESIGDVTALRWDQANGFYRSNYVRGRLLYSLVSKYRPSTVLEIGTGRGYGTACIARALVDNDIDGRVITIDRLSGSDLQSWAIDRGDGARIEELTADEVWKEYFDPLWLDRITTLTGTSLSVTSEWTRRGFPKPDFGFIDAGHRYAEVRYDFYAFMSICNPDFGVLFDDYTADKGFGVKRLIDSEIAPVYDTELIETAWRPTERSEAAAGNDRRGMAFVDSRLAVGANTEPMTTHLISRRLADSARHLRLLQIRDRFVARLGPLKRVPVWLIGKISR